MSTSNGESGKSDAPLELSDEIHIETTDGESLTFKVIGVLQDPEGGASYAVLRHEATEHEEEDEFIITDLEGNLLKDERLAQEILDDFLAFAQEDGEDRGAHDGAHNGVHDGETD
jgi:threonine synthase